MLQPDAQADEPFGDAGGGLGGRGHAGVRHACGVFGQTFNRPQRHSELEVLQGIEEGESCGTAAGELKGNHGAAAVGLF